MDSFSRLSAGRSVFVLFVFITTCFISTPAAAFPGNWKWGWDKPLPTAEHSYYATYPFPTKEAAGEALCAQAYEGGTVHSIVYYIGAEHIGSEGWLLYCNTGSLTGVGGLSLHHLDPCSDRWNDVPVCCPYGTRFNTVSLKCEASCPEDTLFDESLGHCQLPQTDWCSGNPIKTLTGEKLQVETDYVSSNRLLNLRRTYANARNLTRNPIHQRYSPHNPELHISPLGSTCSR